MSTLSLSTPSSDKGKEGFAEEYEHASTKPRRPIAKADDAAIALEGEERVTAFVVFLVTAAAVSGFLFGIDTGIISGTLVEIGDALGSILGDRERELITSATTLGALISALCAGIVADMIGRKTVLAAADVFFTVGAIVQACAHNVATMVAGRFILGFGVGWAACIAPLYLGELSPTRLRGRLVTVNVIFITLGQVVAYGIGAGFAHVNNGWRWMVGICAVPSGIQLIAMHFMPDTPRYYLRKERVEDARKVLAKVYPYASADEIKLKVDLLQASVKESVEVVKGTTFAQRFFSMFTNPVKRRATIVACGLQAFQQLCGFNTLMYYSATLFATIGFDQPTAVGLIVAGTNFVGTLFAFKYIDIIGRRRVMLFSAPGLVFSLTFAAICFHFLTRKTGGDLLENSDYPKVWSSLVLLAIVLYVLSYAVGLGNIPWQQGELFALDVRGIGTSLATGCNWGGNLLISLTYLSLMRKITPAGAFGFYAGLCLLGWIFVLFCFPDLGGLSLEEVHEVFTDSFGIKRAAEMRRRKHETAVSLHADAALAA